MTKHNSNHNEQTNDQNKKTFNEVQDNTMRIMVAAISIATIIMVLTMFSVQGTLSAQVTQVMQKCAPTTAQQGTQQQGTTEQQGTQQQEKVVLDAKQLEDDDPWTGADNASVVVVEFSDFQCPFCGAAAGTNKALIDKFKSQDPTWSPAEAYLKQLAQEGKIKWVFRDFPLSFHQYSEKAAEASQCAFEQGKYWEYHDLLFQNQGALTITDLKAYAKQLNLDTSKFNQCLDSGKYENEVKSDLATGQKLGIQGTPTYIVNDKPLVGAQSAATFKKVIEQELNA